MLSGSRLVTALSIFCPALTVTRRRIQDWCRLLTDVKIAALTG
jgi:hypothetical protein